MRACGWLRACGSGLAHVVVTLWVRGIHVSFALVPFALVRLWLHSHSRKRLAGARATYNVRQGAAAVDPLRAGGALVMHRQTSGAFRLQLF